MDTIRLRPLWHRFGGRVWAIGALAIVVSLHAAALLPFQELLRTRSFDLYQRVLPREPASSPAVIVDIDEASLARLGQWPWPRSLTARLVERIWDHAPAALAIDILMPEPDRSSACDVLRQAPDVDPALARRVCALPGNDEQLAGALRRGPTVLGVAGVESPGGRLPRVAPMRVAGESPVGRVRHHPGVVPNLPVLAAAAAGHAILSADLQRGVVRRVPMLAEIDGTVLPSLSLDALRVAMRSAAFSVRTGSEGVESVAVRDLVVPTQADGSVWVHYAPHDEGRFVSAADVLDGRIDPQLLRGRIVLLGVSGLGLVDLQLTALGERVPGVEVHAQMLEAIADGTTLLRPHWAPAFEGVLMAAVGLAAVFGFPMLRARLRPPVLLLAIAVLALAGLAAFARARLLIDVVSPIGVLMAMSAILLFDALLREELQRQGLEADLLAQREIAARVQGEMEAARRIQMGILPDLDATFARESRLDVAACVEPARQVGGDLHDCFMLDGDRLCVVIGDVCGKGVASSLFMAISKTLCKSLALRDGGVATDPGRLMTELNREVSRDNPEMLFVTAIVAVLDLGTGDFAWCNAGHDAPLACLPGATPVLMSGSAGPALCIIDDFEYVASRTRLRPGELVCLFTDGATEAFSPSRDAFGLPRLMHTLEALPQGAGAAAAVAAVRAAVRGFEAGGEPSDDLTVVAVRWPAP